MKETRNDRIFLFFDYLFLTFILVIVLVPLINIVMCSFSDSKAVAAGRVWLWPIGPTLRGYRAVFENSDVITGYINSAIYTVAGTALGVWITMLTAYPLSRRDFKLARPVMLIFAFTMYFSGGMIPTYLLMSNLHLLNTRTVMILPGILSVYNVIIVRTYMQSSIPQDLHEAAELDGCSDFRYLFTIVMPLSKAVIAVIALYCAVGYWNAYFNGILYLTDRDLYPLQLFLREILIQNQMSAQMMMAGQMSVEDFAARQSTAELLKYSLIIVSSLPMLIIYPFVQKYFVKGVMIGGIKG